MADFVNGNVGLYAQADGVEYFAPVTTDSELDLQIDKPFHSLLSKTAHFA